MDTWMSQKDENSGSTQITVKRCPKCRAIIKSSVRYGNIIKNQFKDVFGIRKKIFGNNQKQKQTQQRMAQKILRQSNQECQFEYVREWLEKQTFLLKLITTKNAKNGQKMDLQLLDVSAFVPSNIE